MQATLPTLCPDWARGYSDQTLIATYRAACQLAHTAHIVFTADEVARVESNKQAITEEMARRGLL